MRIIIAHYKYYIQGGPERYMFKFMDLAEKHGCEVIPFSVHHPNNIKTKYNKYFVGKEDAGANFDINNHSFSYLLEGAYHEFHNKEAYKSMKKLIQDSKPDLLYVLIPGQLTPDIFKAAHEEGVPVVHRISDFRLMCGKYTMLRDGNICEECKTGNYKAMIGHKCLKGSTPLSILRAISCYYTRIFKTYKYVNAIITPPEHTKKLLVESGLFPEGKIFVNPTFIDCSEIKPNYLFKDYVLCLGRFAEEKGFKYVIEALRFLQDTDVKVMITGQEEDCDDYTRKIIKEYNLKKRIIFTGFIKGEELTNIIKDAMCIACPSIWYENMPNVVLEAYSYGKPVIASDLGCLPDLVKNGATGLLFESKNAQQIAECIRKLYESKELTTQLGMNARRYCEEEFSPEKHWERFYNIYTQIRSENRSLS